MKLCRTIAELRSQRQAFQGESVAFVATMGNLHAGHLSLVKRARQLAGRVVVSIYVNPLQFNEASDFEHYPRTPEQDQQLLEAEGVDLLFIPDSRELYPHGQQSNCKVMVPELGDMLEGECRPGHFTGVTTIVNKLFNLVQPDVALFGEKDFQQLMLIRRMVADLNMPLSIEAVPTCRHDNGLAMSSRNNRLNGKQQQQAGAIYQVLSHIVEQLQQGRSDYPVLETDAMDFLRQQGLEPEYVVIRRPADLLPLQRDDMQAVVLAAARLGDVRLIDNIQLTL